LDGLKERVTPANSYLQRSIWRNKISRGSGATLQVVFTDTEG